MTRFPTLLLLLLLGLPACSTSNPSADLGDGAIAPPTWRFNSTDYPRIFDESRDALRDFNFLLERVDAQAGSITTQPRGTGGLATPWDNIQSSFNDELEDAAQRHRRVARLDFIPLTSQETVDNLRAYSGDIELRASVDVYRWLVSGWRLNTLAVLDSTYTSDPALDARNMSNYGVAHTQDTALARRILDSIRARVGAPTPLAEAPAPQPAPTEQPQPAQQQPAAQPQPPAPEVPLDWRKGQPLKRSS